MLCRYHKPPPSEASSDTASSDLPIIKPMLWGTKLWAKILARIIWDVLAWSHPYLCQIWIYLTSQSNLTVQHRVEVSGKVKKTLKKLVNQLIFQRQLEKSKLALELIHKEYHFCAKNPKSLKIKTKLSNVSDCLLRNQKSKSYQRIKSWPQLMKRPCRYNLTRKKGR